MSSPHDTPYEVTHVGGYPFIDHGPVAPQVSIGDIHHIDTGESGADIRGLGHGASGIRNDGLALPADNDLPAPLLLPGLADTPPKPPTASTPPTSGIGDQVPWNDPPPAETRYRPSRLSP